MHTLQQLYSGELKGTTRLQLSCGLTEFPEEIFSLAETLEVLDLSTNRLTALPAGFGRLTKLKIAFFSDNLFTELPAVLADCKALTMIGFKANRITHVPENALPETTRWLILTNNKIQQLPASIGNCIRLQKVALAGNLLTSLPAEMARCRNLELLRISANRLTELPVWLTDLPKLSWLAFAGNPFSHAPQTGRTTLPEIDWKKFEVHEQLGEGASGHIYKALLLNGGLQEDVAVKIFKGEVTSDGLPGDEMQASISAGVYPGLVTLLGKIKGHPQQKQGLVMALIPPAYRNLGLPPSLDTCSRDTFTAGTAFTGLQVLKIATIVAGIGRHLHAKGLMHGDLYAHNILVNESNSCLLTDFGAASFYKLNDAIATKLQQVEARAFGCLLDDLLNLVPFKERHMNISAALGRLRDRLMQEDVAARPLFAECLDVLEALNEKPA